MMISNSPLELSSPVQEESESSLCTLDCLKRGEKAQIIRVDESCLDGKTDLPPGELERRLLEMGFVEGTEISLSHEGPFGRDPIAILIRTCSIVALRRKEARAVLVKRMSTHGN